jgi:hypothetical protein
MIIYLRLKLSERAEADLEDFTDRLAARDLLLLCETINPIRQFLGKTGSPVGPDTSSDRAAHAVFDNFLRHLKVDIPHYLVHALCPVRRRDSGAPTCATRPAPLTPDHGVSMARRCLQRRRTRAYDQAVLECTQQAGDRIVSLALSDQQGTRCSRLAQWLPHGLLWRTLRVAARRPRSANLVGWVY